MADNATQRAPGRDLEPLLNGWLTVGGVAGLIGVMAGAFGAHAVKGRIPGDLLAVFETAVRYHLWHALALLIVAWLPPGRRRRWTGVAFVTGIAVFSGSLYALALSGQRWLGAITPVGGVALMLGWAGLATGGLRGRRR